jgi:hypothetical protein
MTDHPIRLFTSDEAVRHVARGLLTCTLPRAEWTHEAHLGACACLLLEHPDFVAERDLPGTIRAYNLAVGGVNDDTQGYHETITQFSIAAVKAHLATDRDGLLAERVNRLLASERGPARLSAAVLVAGFAVLARCAARLGGTGPAAAFRMLTCK